jgi:hypothetical protein
MTMHLIQTQTVGAGGAGSVVFSNISQEFTHLQLRCVSRGSFNPGNNSAGTVYIYVNGDATASNYYNHWTRGNGASTDDGVNANVGIITLTATIPLSQATASVFGANIVDIYDYRNTNKQTMFTTLGGFDQNSSTSNTSFAVFNTGFWKPTTAVTQLTVSTDGNHIEGSTFSLYGITSSNATGA